MSDVTTRLIADGRNLVVHSYQDVEDIIENNKRLQTIEQKSDWGRHVASIPNNIILQWLNQEWARGNVKMKLFDEDFNKMVAQKLRDPEWAYLRTDAPSTQVGFK